MFDALFRRLAAVLLTAVCLIFGGCEQRPPAASIKEVSPDELFQGAVVLGSPSLTAGIPGDGQLTLDQIRSWLANSANHEQLKIALPLGLRSDHPVPVPVENPLTRAKIELGRQLFFDRRMSRDSTLSCADCHQPVRHFTSDEIAHYSLRETATALNRILGQEQFWDGRAKSLEEQIRFPLENVHEMKTTAAECVARLQSIEGYRLQFEAIFGQVDFESLCSALAAFQRAIVTGPSAWDYDVELRRLQQPVPQSFTADENRWLAKVKSAVAEKPLSDAARRGSELFFSDRTRCAQCHSGPNFTDEQYHDVGLRPRGPANSPLAEKAAADLGRFAVTGDEADRHAFKTPTLRNIAHTWPYFHDGRYHQLEEVVQHFVRGGDATSDIAALDLHPAEVQDLVAFLQALTGSLPAVTSKRLPP